MTGSKKQSCASFRYVLTGAALQLRVGCYFGFPAHHKQCMAKQQAIHVKQDSCLHCRKAMGRVRATSCMPNNILRTWSSVSFLDMLAEQNGVLASISFAMQSHDTIKGSLAVR